MRSIKRPAQGKCGGVQRTRGIEATEAKPGIIDRGSRKRPRGRGGRPYPYPYPFPIPLRLTLRERGVRVAGPRNVLCRGLVLDRKTRRGNHLTGVGACERGVSALAIRVGRKGRGRVKGKDVRPRVWCGCGRDAEFDSESDSDSPMM